MVNELLRSPSSFYSITLTALSIASCFTAAESARQDQDKFSIASFWPVPHPEDNLNNLTSLGENLKDLENAGAT